LPADQCDAWIAFYDGALGGQWSPTPCSRTNPCNCKAMFGPPNPVTCNDAGTSVTQMWVCSSAPTCAHARCRHSAAPHSAAATVHSSHSSYLIQPTARCSSMHTYPPPPPTHTHLASHHTTAADC
jgi:hypothetical protein